MIRANDMDPHTFLTQCFEIDKNTFEIMNFWRKQEWMEEMVRYAKPDDVFELAVKNEVIDLFW